MYTYNLLSLCRARLFPSSNVIKVPSQFSRIIFQLLMLKISRTECHEVPAILDALVYVPLFALERTATCLPAQIDYYLDTTRRTRAARVSGKIGPRRVSVNLTHSGNTVPLVLITYPKEIPDDDVTKLRDSRGDKESARTQRGRESGGAG